MLEERNKNTNLNVCIKLKGGDAMLKYAKMQDSHAQIECNVSSPAD